MSATARLCIASQAAGTRAHKAGIPFADPSGDRLRRWTGLDPANFYDASRVAIVPMGFCFPGLSPAGADLPPRRECAPTWREGVFARLPAIELILAIGRHAIAWHCPDVRGKDLASLVVGWEARLATPERPRVLPLPHPSWRNNSWLRANPWFEAELVPVLQTEIACLVGGSLINGGPAAMDTPPATA